jgi:hypothetical protein
MHSRQIGRQPGIFSPCGITSYQSRARLVNGVAVQSAVGAEERSPRRQPGVFDFIGPSPEGAEEVTSLFGAFCRPCRGWIRIGDGSPRAHARG